MNAAQKLLIIKSLTKNRHLALKIFVFAEQQWVYEKLKFNIHRFYLLQDITPIIHKSDFYLAAKNGHLHMCQWIYRKFTELDCKEKIFAKKSYAFKLAAEKGHLHVCQWLYQIFTELGRAEEIFIDNFYAFRWAARNNHLHVCQWLYPILIDSDHINDILLDSPSQLIIREIKI